jgi:hypothetical protein
MNVKKYCAVFEDGQIRQIVKGVDKARRISPGYRKFRTRLDAEEFAAWWNYENPRWAPEKKKGH